MSAYPGVLALLVFCAVGASGEPEPTFTTDPGKPYPSLAEKFKQTKGWTGGDCAYSIPLGRERTLWLFGDSWIGDIQSGRRVNSRMINNAAAWQNLRDEKETLQFFWADRSGQPAALLRPAEPSAWYWPADGCLVDGRLPLLQVGPPGRGGTGVPVRLVRERVAENRKPAGKTHLLDGNTSPSA